MDKKRRQQCLFWGILVMAAAVRCIRFAQVPAGINQDEAMAAMDAWALAQYGTDRYGIRFPVHFTAWKYGQMSVLLSYCMIPFIRIFGFGTFAVRLPMLLASCGSVVLVYLTGKKLFSDRMAIGLMLLTAVNPWHFMQSRWSLDCNLLPHVFLLGFYLLLLGFEKRRYLYLSMVFFGLTLYCYGVAVYSVIPFLAVYAGWCLWKKQLRGKEVLLCAGIFLAVSLPELLVMGINFFGLSTIETPFFTMSYFPESVRSNDILFLNFSFLQLKKNLNAMVGACILQLPDHLHNAIPEFGPLYDISTPFVVTGIITFTRDLFREKDPARQTRMMALWGFFITGVWIGLITYEVNVNRINLIFFPLIFLCGYGIAKVCALFRRAWMVILPAYGLCFALFLGAYFTSFEKEIKTNFNVNFLEAVKEADEMEAFSKLYITGHMDWQYNLSMAEILTQYACRIDALYYQEQTAITGGRELLPYGERYHFINVNYSNQPDPEGLYLLHISELEKLDFPCTIIKEIGNYILLQPAVSQG